LPVAKVYNSEAGNDPAKNYARRVTNRARRPVSAADARSSCGSRRSRGTRASTARNSPRQARGSRGSREGRHLRRDLRPATKKRSLPALGADLVRGVRQSLQHRTPPRKPTIPCR
jgi:hypothetical protein